MHSPAYVVVPARNLVESQTKPFNLNPRLFDEFLYTIHEFILYCRYSSSNEILSLVKIQLARLLSFYITYQSFRKMTLPIILFTSNSIKNIVNTKPTSTIINKIYLLVFKKTILYSNQRNLLRFDLVEGMN